ncbi:hypothetical protein TNCV_3934821 [Trichonephila clavipes]|nr:hypothetical protein TNCV_3934821 [Trichonephila clavipes]
MGINEILNSEDELDELKTETEQKRAETVNWKSFVFHQDNLKCLSTRQKLPDLCPDDVLPPLFSPDHASSDFQITL